MVLTAPSVMTNKFVGQFQMTSWLKFTGYLDVRGVTRQNRGFYFHMGRLVWATDLHHRTRRWRRCLSQTCPHLQSTILPTQKEAVSQTWEYLMLKTFVQQGKITREQAIAVIEAVLTEILFDILQESQTDEFIYTLERQVNLDAPLIAISSEKVLVEAQQTLAAWVDMGLMHQSPNWAPLVKEPDLLRQRTTPKTYKTLISALNGKFTLRELAVQTQQPLVGLMRSLLPYLKTGLIDLVEVSDFPDFSNAGKHNVGKPTADKQLTKPKSVKPGEPKVMCVDDSVQVCQKVEGILTPAGYQLISIQDSVQALPTLLEHKPNLILLDLVMPVANGYEICSQIRRISAFKQTPVVILTGNDGIVDRVRAKLVGASDFLAKPIDAEKLLAVVRKHVAVSPG